MGLGIILCRVSLRKVFQFKSPNGALFYFWLDNLLIKTNLVRIWILFHIIVFLCFIKAIEDDFELAIETFRIIVE